MKLNKETYEKIIHSKEFKNWFGDWENPDSKTSKIVDSTGKPLVVYHGSPYKFTEFKYNINQTSTQVSAGGGFWFSNDYKVAEHFSTCYPKSYYDELDKLKTENFQEEKRLKIDVVKNLKMDDYQKDGILDSMPDVEMEKLISDIQNNKYWDIVWNIMLLVQWEGIRNVKSEIAKKIHYISKKNDDNYTKKRDEIKKFYDEQPGYIYPCFIYATNIIIRKGEDVGFGFGRLELESDKNDCIIIKNADTGPYIADEYVVFNPKRIKIATGENKTYNKNSKNIYEYHIITKLEIFEKMSSYDSYKNQIETISKNIVREINETEFDYGKCDQISIEIANAIKNVFNVDCNVLKIDSAKIKGEHVWLEHAICVETEHHMVIDTQLWQEFNNNTPDDLDKRKVIFDWEEYNEIVTILDSSLWYTTNEDEENDNEI